MQMIELKTVSAGYGKKEILHRVSVSFEKGRLTSLIGSNGCGKSTLLKAVSGLIPTKNGEINVDGIPLASLKRGDAAKLIAYLPQGNNIPDMTAEELVLHGRFPYLSYPRRYTEKDRAIALDAMKKLGVNEYAHVPLAALSGGMRQNAYLAMALAQDTEYILLDEPTTYLDISHRIGLMKMLRKLADEGKGIIAVMHELPLAFEFSDTVAVMENGVILASDTPDSISECGIVSTVFGVPICRDSDGTYFHRY